MRLRACLPGSHTVTYESQKQNQGSVAMNLLVSLFCCRLTAENMVTYKKAHLQTKYRNPR